VTTSFDTQVDERTETLTISNEELSIPSSSPYKVRLAEVPDRISGTTGSAISSATKNGSGSGDITISGPYTGVEDKSYKIEIDSAGELGDATFKWSDTGGTTWNQTGVTTGSDIPLNNGLHVTFTGGSGTDFELGDHWTFSARELDESEALPSDSDEYYVNYTTGDVTFHSDRAGWTAWISYEGRGTLVDAADINQITTAINELESNQTAVFYLDIFNAIIPTSGGAQRTIQDNANFSNVQLDFDPDTEEAVYFQFPIPKRIASGDVTIKILWKSTATSGDCLFSGAYLSKKSGEGFSDESLTDQAGTAVTVDSNAGYLNESTITFSNLSLEDGDIMILKIYRDADNASDTMDADASVVSIRIDLPVNPKDS